MSGAVATKRPEMHIHVGRPCSICGFDDRPEQPVKSQPKALVEVTERLELELTDDALDAGLSMVEERRELYMGNEMVAFMVRRPTPGPSRKPSATKSYVARCPDCEGWMGLAAVLDERSLGEAASFMAEMIWAGFEVSMIPDEEVKSLDRCQCRSAGKAEE